MRGVELCGREYKKCREAHAKGDPVTCLIKG